MVQTINVHGSDHQRSWFRPSTFMVQTINVHGSDHEGWLRASARYPESLGVTSFPFVGGDGFR
jgi:hypothetical protein